ncbi:glycine--tRNA ligase subunit alpha [Actinomadura sp. 3N508]|uniref:glycine--tRNA ligase subunit alpha n=1 Tax=Actinomadura sp. 3N508 TaxID=3375153 RepID=UPI00379E939C
MQDALIRLTGYWAGHGCLIAQPMNTEVGAGTLNPSTALRVLGPEPWRVAYAEPSVRPDDVFRPRGFAPPPPSATATTRTGCRPTPSSR